MSYFTPVAILVLVIFFLSAALRILNEYERGVIFRLGRVIAAKGPGLIILIPLIDKMVKVSLRLVAMDVDPQDVITRDNVSVKVNAVIYFRVIEPIKAIVEVENYSYAMSQLAQTTLRSVCGQSELDDLLAEGKRSTRNCKKSWIPIPIHGVLKSPLLSSNTLICPGRCSGRLHDRLRLSGNDGPR